ncbi:T9SS type A sorting domain-containing protein [Mariniflexile ostreae]|uniref:T9SS type A sorting domain-containing protein n=1 Tax=Mariniflexile ostreae TaxID=1520892 RepID=A0ABV5FA91_9FLAO
MNAIKTISVLSLLFFFNFNYSQTGPGGVGDHTSNGLWLKADDIILENKEPVTFWPDASGNNNDALSTNPNEQPEFNKSSALNTMPAINLDGKSTLMTVDDKDILDGSSSISLFSVIKPESLDEKTPRGILSKRYSSGNSDNYAYSLFFYTKDFLYVDINTTKYRVNTGNPAFTNSTPYILQMDFDGSLGSNQRTKIYDRGNLIATKPQVSNKITNNSTPLTIGMLPSNNNSYYAGEISEIIHFNYAINKAQRIIVNNYLAAKYNIPIHTDIDYYQQDNMSNGEYDYHVAGIGKADDGSQQINSQGSGIVRIELASTLKNDQFLFWGQDKRDLNYNFYTNNTDYIEYLDTQWRVSNRNELGKVDVYFDISHMINNSVLSLETLNCSPLQLIISDSPDFSDLTVHDLSITETPPHSIKATGVTFKDNQYFKLRYVDQIVWDGANYFNGSGINSAPHNENDSCLKLTVLAGTATLTEDALVREVNINSGSELIVNGTLLSVEKGVEIGDNGTIDLKNEAQLIQNHEGETSNTGIGTLKIRQKGSGNAFNHNYWSSPVNREGNWQIGFLEDPEGHPVKFSAAHTGTPGTPPTLSTRWLHKFDGTNHYNNWVRLSTSDLLAPGLGYTMKGSGLGGGNLQEYIFEGTPNDGDYTIPVTAGFNILVGNPYPSALDAYQFITDNIDVIDGTLYFWEHFPDNNSHYLADYKGGYASYNLTMSVPSPIPFTAAAVAGNAGSTSTNGAPSKGAPTGFIPVGQGFFVTVNSAPVDDIIFNNSQRVFAKVDNGASVFYRTNATKNKQTTNGDSRPKLWFSFTTKDYIKTIGLGYDLNTTYGYDNAYDAESYDYLQDDIYWLLPENSKKLSIQALPSINLEDNLPLEIKATHAGVYKFEIGKMENIPADLPIYLKDNTKNMYYNLRDGEANLYLNTGLQQKQFSIVFKEEGVLGTDIFEEKTLFTTYNPKSNILQIHSSSKETTTAIDVLAIYNSLGQEVIYIKSPNLNNVDVSQLSNGVYILKLNSKNVKNPNGIKFVKY